MTRTDINMKKTDTTWQNYEDYLREVHARAYTGTDDHMPDAFETWLETIEPQDFIDLGESYGKDLKSLLEPRERELVEAIKEDVLDHLIAIAEGEKAMGVEGKESVEWRTGYQKGFNQAINTLIARFRKELE